MIRARENCHGKHISGGEIWNETGSWKKHKLCKDDREGTSFLGRGTHQNPMTPGDDSNH